MLGYFLSLCPPGFRILRVIFFSPVIISAAAMSMIFLGVYAPEGILNSLLHSFGLENLTRVWLANRQTALGSVIAVELWAGIGFYAVLFFAALSNVSEEIYEAARLDGANEWVLMWKIALPMVRDFFGVALVLHFLWLLLGSASTVLLLTAGGPGTRTLTLGYYIYELAFISRKLGYSQAVAVVVFMLGVIGLIFIRKFTQEESK